MAGTIYKITRIEKAPADTTHPYAKISKEALELAGANLSPKGFCCWIHFAALPLLNKNPYAIIPADMATKLPYKKDTIQDGVKELITKRYLVPIENQKLSYIFHEIAATEIQSAVEQDETPDHPRRPRIDTGIVVNGQRFDF